MMRCGIDPGITGSLALLDDQLGYITLIDMPVMALGKNKHQVNAAELTKILKEWQNKYGSSFVVYLELVHTMPKQGISSSGNFMESVGVIKGVLGALAIPMVLITPGAWKKRAGLTGKPKDMARTLIQQLYPEAPLGRKKDIGRADAIAIARFGAKGQ